MTRDPTDIFNEIFGRDDGQPTTKPRKRTYAEWIAETPPVDVTLLQLTDWATAYDRPPVEAIVDGLLFEGRWTSFVAPGKLGKSTLELHIAHCLARGIDPFEGTAAAPVPILYLDGEMGEIDVTERLTALELTPADLTRLHYTDLFPKGDTVQGGAAIVSTANTLGVAAVILDGLNAFVTGAENDDTPWRNLFDNTVMPLKRAGIAVLTADNNGKDIERGSRGSSVKVDKPDGIIQLKRTDDGINLRTTHRRTNAYLTTIDLVVTGLHGDQPINYRRVSNAWPVGTRDAAALLDRLGIPATAGREKARAALKSAGERLATDVLAAALRYRKADRGQVEAFEVGQ